MTKAEVDALKEGDAISLMASTNHQDGTTRSFRGRVDMVTDNYIRVSWPAADEYRGDIVMKTSPIWEAMVKR